MARVFLNSGICSYENTFYSYFGRILNLRIVRLFFNMKKGQMKNTLYSFILKKSDLRTAGVLKTAKWKN